MSSISNSTLTFENCGPPSVVIHREGETAGIRWQIVSGMTPGYRWRIQVYADHLGTTMWKESSGAFYDGVHDHPEGGIAWASDSVQRHLTQAEDV